jgi:hypothetical protein
MKVTQEVWESVTAEVRFSQRELAYEKELREYEQYKKEQIRNHQHVRSFEDWRRS